jgi:microsomal dipeptidase-like Zn-dependent dipeptidase
MNEATRPAGEAPTPVADLHCDLLSYLAVDPARSADDPRARCSLPQLRAGRVRFQVLAMFVMTGPDSTRSGMAQARLFRRLVDERREDVVAIRDARRLAARFEDGDDRVGVVAAIENASGFCGEDDTWEQGIERLREMLDLCGRPLYVSLTWNDENRFGGGNNTRVGLKDDGRRLLDLLAESGIAVDFSHTSDDLAEGILEHIDRHGLPLRVLASHSNYRALVDTPRNLPDDLAREIVRRGGLQGINFMAPFIGPDDPDNLYRQIEYGVELVGSGRVAFGADFFCSDDLPPHIRRRVAGRPFFEGRSDATCYPEVLRGLRHWPGNGAVDEQALCWRNVARFVEGLWAG